MSFKVQLKSECMPTFLADVKLCIKFLNQYPFQPPSVVIPSIFHPNVYAVSNRLCISALDSGTSVINFGDIKNSWRPSLCIENVLVGIIQLLKEPNPDSPANIDANKMFLR